LVELWHWQRHEPADRTRELAALWLFTWWVETGRREPVRGTAWLDALLGGESAAAAFKRLRPAESVDAEARERHWRVAGWHRATRATLPGWSAAESRARLRELGRIVLTDAEGQERVMSVDELWAARDDPVVAAEVAWRLDRLGIALPRLHAFYTNAAISAGRGWEAWQRGDAAAWADARDQLAADLAVARELADVTGAALDALNALGP
jgi:hypothetical protein